MLIDCPNWRGRIVVCIASGPSLTQADCELVRASGHVVVVTNTAFVLCPWADALYAHDTKWWRRYHDEVMAGFAGRRFAASAVAAQYGAEATIGLPWFKQFHNSGACAVSLAISGDAKKIVMLGYDAEFGKNGETHFHGDHPPELKNAESIGLWPRQFAILAKYAKTKGAEIANASRNTALTCFERGKLEDVL